MTTPDRELLNTWSLSGSIHAGYEAVMKHKDWTRRKAGREVHAALKRDGKHHHTSALVTAAWLALGKEFRQPEHLR